MKETIIYKFNDIRVHVEDLIDEYDDFYKKYLHKLKTLNKNAEKYTKKKLRIKFRYLAYTIQGHSMDIIETLKKCNDYLYLNNHKVIEELDVLVDVDEFRHIRRQFKKNNSSKIKALYECIRNFKGTRNHIAHMITEEFSVFPITHRKNVLDALRRYLYLLDKLDLTSEFEQASKRNSDINKQRIKASKVFDGVELIANDYDETPLAGS